MKYACLDIIRHLITDSWNFSSSCKKQTWILCKETLQLNEGKLHQNCKVSSPSSYILVLGDY